VKKSSTQSTPNTPTPPSQITPPPSTNTTYTVQAGDTLSTIATKFNTTIDTIKSLNNLSNYTIFVGQTLKVKAQTLAIFNWPTDGIITSGFGTRPEFRPGEFHYGLDIAKNGNVEVKAAADGVVTRSYLSDSYGEVVFIKHQINGQTYETVYAHMRTGSRAVQVGDIVKAGQFIGWMGATGDATGQHLHFEVNKGLWTANKANEVDPLLYLK
jgi:murein DD-endopeptidase MepM/ murein hydrolase activator NlpD